MVRKESLPAKLDSYFEHLVSQRSFSGSVLVARTGTIILRKGFGEADQDHHLRNTWHNEFRLAGLASLFTVTAILQLQERGKLSVQDLVCTHLAACPAAWQAITIHDMLDSSAGLYDPLNEEPGFDPSQASRLTIVEEAEKHPPERFPLGVVPPFCNTCMLVLDLLVEKASGEPFTRFIEQNIFRSLHMIHSGCHQVAFEVPP